MAFSKHIGSLESPNCIDEDRVDVYIDLNSLLKRDEKDELLPSLKRALNRFIKVFLKDIAESTTEEVVHAALRTLGYFIHHNELANVYTAVQARNILTALAELMLRTTDKTTCNLCVWCISSQSLSPPYLDAALLQLVEAVSFVLSDKQPIHDSSTLQYECLLSLLHLLRQHPRGMLSPDLFNKWLVAAYYHAFNSASKVRELAQELVARALSHDVDVPSFVSAATRRHLVDEGGLETLRKFASEKNSSGRHAIRTWASLFRLLGKHLHGNELLNQLLKIPELTFTDSSPAVRVETFIAWKVFIDLLVKAEVGKKKKNPSEGPAVSKNKLDIMITPFKNRQKVESVAVVRRESLRTWVHLIRRVCWAGAVESSKNSQEDWSSLVSSSKAGEELLKVFPHICSPLFQNFLDDTNAATSDAAFEILGIMLSTDASVGLVPQLPSNFNDSKYLQLLEDNVPLWCSSILRAVLTAAVTGDEEGRGNLRTLWRHLLRRTLRRNTHASFIVSLVRCAARVSVPTTTLIRSNDRANGRWVAAAIRMVEELLVQGGSAVSQNVMPLSFEEDKKSGFTKKDGSACSPVLYMACAWLNGPQIPDDHSEAHKNLFSRLIEIVFSSGYSASGDNLSSAKELMSTLESATDGGVVRTAASAWEYWSHVARYFQGHLESIEWLSDSSYSAIYSILLLPVKRLVQSSSIEGFWTRQSTAFATWGSLYTSFHRAVTLQHDKSRVISDAVENLVMRISSVTESIALENSPGLSLLLNQCLGSIVESLDLSNVSHKSKGGGLWGIPERTVIGRLLRFMSRLLSSGLAAFTGELWSESVLSEASVESRKEALILHCYNTLSALGSLAAGITHPSDAIATCHYLQKNICDWLRVFQNSAIAAASSTENLLQALHSALNRLLLCISRCGAGFGSHGEFFTSEILENMAPLLEVVLSHPLRPIRNSGVVFWQDSFGKKKSIQSQKKKSDNNRLVYPKSLSGILAALHAEEVVTLPDWDRPIGEVLVESSYMSENPELPASILVTAPSNVAPMTGNNVSTTPKLVRRSAGSSTPTLVSPVRSNPGLLRSPKKSPSKTKRSPTKVVASPVRSPQYGAKRRKLALPEFAEEESQDFVDIVPSPTKFRGPLTERQLERRRELREERKSIPSMYTELDTTLTSALERTQSSVSLTGMDIQQQQAETMAPILLNVEAPKPQALLLSVLSHDEDDPAFKYPQLEKVVYPLLSESSADVSQIIPLLLSSQSVSSRGSSNVAKTLENAFDSCGIKTVGQIAEMSAEEVKSTVPVSDPVNSVAQALKAFYWKYLAKTPSPKKYNPAKPSPSSQSSQSHTKKSTPSRRSRGWKLAQTSSSQSSQTNSPVLDKVTNGTGSSRRKAKLQPARHPTGLGLQSLDEVLAPKRKKMKQEEEEEEEKGTRSAFVSGLSRLGSEIDPAALAQRLSSEEIIAAQREVTKLMTTLLEAQQHAFGNIDNVDK